MQHAKRLQGELTSAEDGASRVDHHDAFSELDELDDAGVWYALEESPNGSGRLDLSEFPEENPLRGFAHAAAVGAVFWAALLLILLL